MSDLISRSAIIDWINNQKQPLRYHKQVAGTDETIFTREVLTTMQKCIEVFETFINNLPTAYDVDDGNADIYGAGYKLGYEDGYNLAILDKEKQITALYEDCENGAEDDVVLGWNRAIDKVREVIKAGGNNDNR